MRTFPSRTPTMPGYYNKPNPILTEFRLECDYGDLFGSSVEWLFQLARHWSEWQSPRIGTFPLDYRDLSGPATREYSEETGEDSVYWTIEAVLDDVCMHEPGSRDGHDEADLVQDYIVHATAVLDRIYNMAELTGTSY